MHVNIGLYVHILYVPIMEFKSFLQIYPIKFADNWGLN